MSRLARYSWGVLTLNLAVIAWGGYVRATRSGAGCGAHWPLCNGEVIPQSPSVEMLVEFSHRATSGLAFMAVVVLLAWTWRRCPAGHRARRAAAWAMFFMVTEAAVGAALVLFRLVADNPSMARALFMSVHLVNTFALLACLALAARWLSGRGGADVPRPGGGPGWPFVVAAIGMLLAGVSGAVAALGDTLYPARSLTEALGAELSATSHVLVRLRLLHPAITVFVATGLVLIGARAAAPDRTAARPLGVALVAMAIAQLAAGLLNVALLAPVWMQIVHLLLADLLWICLVLLAAERRARIASTMEAIPRNVSLP